MATLTVPGSVPPVSEDSEQLRKAFEGWGTNEDLIINILAHRNAAQRNAIRKCYSEAYGEDLLKALDKELTQDFERIVLLWTLDPADRDALLANESTKKASRHQVILEIACTRTPKQLFYVKEAYHAKYKKSLEEDVAQHTSENFRKLLLLLVSVHRYDGDEVNMHLAKTEAKTLHEKIHDKAYADDDLIRILTTRSRAQIAATINTYKNEFGNDINKDLKEDPKDDYLLLLRSTIKCLVRPEKYFAKLLRLSIEGHGTDEGALTRVISTRAEIDLKIIKEEYQRRTSVALDKAIVKDTNGDYEKMLLALIGHTEA
jgi:hypothetical protein